MSELALRHLTSIADLDADRALALLELARGYLEVTRRTSRKVGTLRGKTVVNLFFEASTRTRTSFELAGKRLGADVVNVSAATSSSSKGESLVDTVANIDSMHADVVVVRHPASGAAHYLAHHARVRSAIVNAGDGMHEHPTQALLDAFTIREHKGDLRGLVVAICGDILHSRVARSNVALLGLLGAHVRLAGPRTFLPHRAEALGVPVFDRIEPAIDGADVVMMLRIQQERLAGASFSTLREYSRVFGLNPRRLGLAKADAIVMHPGPINRGVELSDELADGPRSVILEQVEAGVALRMAVLAACAAEPGAPRFD